MDTRFPCWIISVEPSIFHKPRNISSERRGIAAFPQYWIRGSAVRMFYRNPPHTRARPSVGVGMADGRRRQPASDEAPHAIPEYAAVLAAPRQRAMPEPPYLEPKNPQRV